MAMFSTHTRSNGSDNGPIDTHSMRDFISSSWRRLDRSDSDTWKGPKNYSEKAEVSVPSSLGPTSFTISHHNNIEVPTPTEADFVVTNANCQLTTMNKVGTAI
eukprot:scaffold12127_cov69-Skeletonema_menzelii.AAC.1